jgi:predicted nucleic acid-binding protein
MSAGRRGGVKTKSVLDAFALLAYLKEEAGHARVKKILASAGSVLFINAMNLGEVYYILARSRGIRTAEFFLSNILPSLPVIVIENSLEDVIEAARLKARYSLSFADCFAASTAIREHATLVTGDPEFRKLGKVVAIDWVG